MLKRDYKYVFPFSFFAISSPDADSGMPALLSEIDLQEQNIE